MRLRRYGWSIAAVTVGISGALLAQTENKKAFLDIYGHAMLDMGYQSGSSDPDWYNVVRPSKLPVYAKQYGGDGNLFASVRQIRLGFIGLIPTEHGDIKTIFEFDLFGVGRCWSVFTDLDVLPNSIEYWGPSGMVFFRNIQLRYMPLQGDNAAAISLEKPGGGGDPGVQAGLPLFVGPALMRGFHSPVLH